MGLQLAIKRPKFKSLGVTIEKFSRKKVDWKTTICHFESVKISCQECL